jgi:hypothetical protein
MRAVLSGSNGFSMLCSCFSGRLTSSWASVSPSAEREPLVRPALIQLAIFCNTVQFKHHLGHILGTRLAPRPLIQQIHVSMSTRQCRSYFTRSKHTAHSRAFQLVFYKVSQTDGLIMRHRSLIPVPGSLGSRMLRWMLAHAIPATNGAFVHSDAH